jgi:uncharacterized protein
MCLGRDVTVLEALALTAAGLVAGVFSTVAGLASIVSYPALLAIGLPPLSANMTNTVALLFTGVGAAAGSRPELTGQGARLRRLAPAAAVGGATGAALLLVTPSQTFVRVAPVLIGAASLALLARPRPGPEPRDTEGGADGPGRHDSERGGGGPGRRDSERGGGGPGRRDRERGGGGPGRRDRERGGGARPGRRERERSGWLLAGVFGVAVYVGYFGAAAGIVMLAILIVMLAGPLARTNAVKNILGGVANAVAAAAFAVFGHVDWAAVAPLAAGFLAGGWTGPALVRQIPGQVLRIGVAVCGLAVAVKLGVSAYR